MKNSEQLEQLEQLISQKPVDEKLLRLEYLEAVGSEYPKNSPLATMHSTYQSGTFYIDPDNLPGRILDLLESQPIQLVEYPGGAKRTYVELENINIEGAVFNLDYTIEYFEEYQLEDIEDSLFLRAEEFLADDGFIKNIYLYEQYTPAEV